MKIGNSGENSSAKSVTNGTSSTTDTSKASSTSTTSGAIPAEADPSAKIALSSEATNLLSKNGSADFDAEKVAKVSSQIDNKTYKVNAEAIADKLIANAKEVLAKT